MKNADIRQWSDEFRNTLRQEMASAALRMDMRQAEYMRGLGVPVALMLEHNLIGTVTVEVDSRDFWTPIDTGKAMVVTPLVEDGATLDLIAFDPKDPDIWFLRTGEGWALGCDAVRDAVQGWDSADKRLSLHATPLDWLRAGSSGACVTQWTPESRSAVRHVDAIVVTSIKFARALRLELSRPPRIPEIEVKGAQSRAA
ncbi:hypothetical protein [Sphingobium sp. BS19]|uniref:hypothetical protein n=1 Tax=Sphingobium sp. BS19 TaxID=3018973 RepID=UPI0022EF2803|nr:hypothetical protein [Sphingobium sp. BS19]GLI99147.1 hypothetical protein Sbs19_29650 [Sphingobium sp. BS19]